MVQSCQPVGGARSILDAALSLFMRLGFESVSVAQIAAQARVSKANVFHHFSSKEALYIDVMQEASKGHAEFAEQLLREELSSAEKLRRLAAWEFEDNARNEGRVRMLLSEVFGGCNTQTRQLARKVFRRNFDAVIGLFAEGQKRGEFRRDFDPAVTAAMLGATATLYGQTREGLRHFDNFHFADDPRGYANAVCDLMLASILRKPVTELPKKKRTLSSPAKNIRSKKQ